MLLPLLLCQLKAQPVPSTPLQDAPRNLGPAINTEWDDFIPLISADGGTLYFTRAVPAKRDDMEWDFDIYYSVRGPDGRWSTAQEIGAPLNSWDLNDLLSVSPDGNTALLGRRYLDDGETANGFSIAHRTAAGWSQPEDVEIEDYTNNSSMRSASLCADGRSLLLAVSGDDARGNLDLYVSFLQEDGRFSEPMNLGDDCNTEELEASPFLAADGVTLYFSSAGHGGYGNNDIFVSRRLDTTWRHWSPPINLGPQVNSEGYDASYTVSARGDYAYMISYRNTTGGKDIYEVPLSAEDRPRSTVLVSGRVVDAKTGVPIDALVRYELLPEGREVGTGRAVASDGYQIVLPSGGLYGVRAEAHGYYAVHDHLDLTTVTGYHDEQHDLSIVPVEVGVTVRLNNVFFDVGRSTLTPASSVELSRVVAMMQANGAITIEIAGHTDNVGSDAENLGLSRERAQAVFAYIAAGGIAGRRMRSVGYGATKPLAENDTEQGRQLNRRVEFTILSR